MPVPKVASKTKYIPAAGSDDEFDKRLESALSAIRSTHVTFDEEQVKLSIAIMIANERGLPLESAFKPAEPPPPPKPVVISLERLTEVASGDDHDYFWEPKNVTDFTSLWIDMTKAQLSRAAVMAIGPSGCGKTEGFIRAFKNRDIPFLVVHCATITDPEKWLGHKEIDENGTRFVLSDLLLHVQKPGATIFDEVTRLHPSILNVPMSLLDDQRRIQVPELQGERGEPFYIHVHPEHMFVGTANIGTGYGGTYQMDVALMERFPFRLPRDFPPARDEVKVLMKRTGLSKEDADALVWVANKSRAMWRDEKIARPISTRTLIHWATLVSAGMPIPQAAEFAVLGSYRDESADAEDVMQIRALIEGKGGKVEPTEEVTE